LREKKKRAEKQGKWLENRVGDRSERPWEE
jgi:hypothetical protein